MNVFDPFVILSAYKVGYPEELNQARHRRLGIQLHALHLETLEVTYVLEKVPCPAFLVDLPQGEASPHFEKVASIANWFGQATLLSIGADGSASLLLLGPTLDGEPAFRVSLGPWHETDRATAARRARYVEHEGRFYVAG